MSHHTYDVPGTPGPDHCGTGRRPGLVPRRPRTLLTVVGGLGLRRPRSAAPPAHADTPLCRAPRPGSAGHSLKVGPLRSLMPGLR
ncbi:hypothetical protein Vwe01_18720 [Micromonospora andamanensis]|nr:hypothetical protein Vwe01_18720 [Micromonospora andamanensis]